MNLYKTLIIDREMAFPVDGFSMEFARPAAGSDQAGLGELVYCGSIKVNWVYCGFSI